MDPDRPGVESEFCSTLAFIWERWRTSLNVNFFRGEDGMIILFYKVDVMQDTHINKLIQSLTPVGARVTRRN